MLRLRARARRQPVTVVLLLLLAVVITIIRVRSDTADTFVASKLDASIQHSLAAHGLSATTVDCPDGLPARAGDSFQCEVTGRDRTSAKVHVKVVNSELGVRLSGLVNTALVERELATQVRSATGTRVAGRCADVVRLDLGARFRCTVRAASGGVTTYAATVITRDGEVTLKAAPS